MVSLSSSSRKNNGDRPSSVLGRDCGGRRDSEDNVNLETDQIISQDGKTVELIISGSKLGNYVLAFDIAEFTERLPEHPWGS